jgi:predicted small lipoprotein YifL
MMRCRTEEPEELPILAAATRLALVLAALALAGCGVKGPPEPPPGGVQATMAAEAAKAGQKVDTSQPLKPDKKLWLDYLL